MENKVEKREFFNNHFNMWWLMKYRFTLVFMQADFHLETIQISRQKFFIKDQMGFATIYAEA